MTVADLATLPVHAHSVPAILAVGDSGPSWEALLRRLTIEGYLVLSAHSGTEALSVAKTHSRPIHLLLLEEAMAGSGLLAELGPYQPGIRALIATASLETTVERVKRLLDAPKRNAAAI